MQFLKSQENIGIVFAMFAYLTFSIVDVFQKYASVSQSIFQLLLFRYLFLLIFSVIESKRKNNNIFWKSKNFLSYSYVLHKFCELLEFDNLLEYFPLLKSREKLHQQDLIWEKICKDLNWEFIPSL